MQAVLLWISEESFRGVLETALRDGGFTTHTPADAREAAAYIVLASRGILVTPDLVVVGGREDDGIAKLARLRLPGIPLVALDVRRQPDAPRIDQLVRVVARAGEQASA
jgi:hypothetical protein